MNQKKSQSKPSNSPKTKIGSEGDSSKLYERKDTDRRGYLTDIISGISDVIYATDLQLESDLLEPRC